MTRLTKPEQFTLVYTKGGSWHSDHIVLRAMPNGLQLSRCGFSVGKKVGKAVVRNRIKRILREIVRSASVNPGWDIIFIARSNVALTKFADLNVEVFNLLGLSRILRNITPRA